MLTLFKLLNVNGLSNNEVRFVRHSDFEINTLDTFKNQRERFNEYAAWQRPSTYGDAKYLLMFAPETNKRAFFLGLYHVNGLTKNKQLNQTHKSKLLKLDLFDIWYETHDFYHLELSETMLDLSLRLVVN